MAKNDFLSMIAAHLNAPYGTVVHAHTVAAMFRAGTIKQINSTDLEASLLQTLFVECSPALIGRGCIQAGADIQNAQNLYKETLSTGMPRVERWEEAVEGAVEP